MFHQGRYKSFVLEGESYFLTFCRYVERNAARAGVVERAEQLHWLRSVLCFAAQPG